MGRLDVQVVEARNLTDVQCISTIDPYSKLFLEDQHFRTNIINNEINPQWNETLKFFVGDEHSAQLLLEVWNDNIMRDDMLGLYIMSLSGLKKGVPYDYWAPLKKSPKTNAEIHIKLFAHDFGDDPTIADLERAGMTKQQYEATPGYHALDGGYSSGSDGPGGVGAGSGSGGGGGGSSSAPMAANAGASWGMGGGRDGYRYTANGSAAGGGGYAPQAPAFAPQQQRGGGAIGKTDSVQRATTDLPPTY